MEKKRIPQLDAMKGFAILAVVLGHIFGGYRSSGMWPEANAALRAVYNIIYTFHMPLFMTISGYVYRAAYVSPDGIPDRRRILRRVIDLIAVYLLFSLLFGFVKIGMSRFVNTDVTMHDILRIPVMAIDLFWYLYVLICQYLLFSIRGIHRLRPDILLAAFAAVSLGVTVSPLPHQYWLELTKNLYYPFFFWLGICLCTEQPRFVKSGWLALVGFLAAGSLIAAYLHYKLYIYCVPAIGFIVQAGMTVALWYFFRRVQLFGESRFLRFLGGYSMEIYVLHCFLTAGLRAVFPRFGITNLWLSIALNLLLSTALPIAAAWVLRRIGWHGIFFRPVSFWKNKKA